VDRILEEFGINPAKGHIINGHVPVKVVDGESPIKAGGKLFIIDGGLSKAYHAKTGIAGYTLIYNSTHLALAEHRPFVVGEENTPTIHMVEQMPSRVLVRDTDTGAELLQQIDDLTQLIEAYEDGKLQI
jgi:fructose-1,6-bisphosphatase-3